MNYRDLQNISNLSQEILIEGANKEHNVLNRWPYTSPYLQESTELDESGKNDARIRENIKSFGSNYTPPRDWDQSANRGKGAVLNAKQKEKQRRKTVAKSSMGEGYDLYDIILSHLLDEGYAETQEQAEVIMVNMSEDWRDDIIDEAYVDYRKGKLSTGKSPQQRMSSRLDRMKATATRERGEASSTDSLMTPATKRSQKMGAVKREMDAHTSLGGVLNKAISPGLGNRAGASPRVAYGEPNTDRHQMARFRRGEPSTK